MCGCVSNDFKLICLEDQRISEMTDLKGKCTNDGSPQNPLTEQPEMSHEPEQSITCDDWIQPK